MQNEKASFARVEKIYPGDYDVSFKDAQKVQKFRQKLFRTRTILDGSLQIVNLFRNHCNELSRCGLLEDAASLFRELEDMTASLTYQNVVVAGLIAHSSGTAALVS
jgi:hypothetical protein